MKQIILVVAWCVATTTMVRAQQPSTVHGRLVGGDGRPMRAACVGIERGGGDATVQVDAEGRFSLPVTRRGVVSITCAGVGHSSYTFPVLIDEPGTDVEVQVRLGRHVPAKSFDSLGVVGDFNDWDWGTAVRLRSGRGGIYRATIKAPKGAKEFTYQIVGLVPNRSVNGTDGDRFEYDGGGDWRTVIPVKKGVAVVTFDPKRMPQGDAEPMVAHTDPLQREVQDLVVRLRDHRTAIAMAARDSNSPVNVAARIADINKSIDAASTQSLKRLRSLELLAVISWYGRLDSASAVRTALEMIGPESTTWELSPTALPQAIALTNTPGDYDGYVRRFLAGPVSAETRGLVGYVLCYEARSRKDTAAVARYFALLNDELRATSYGKIATTEFDPARSIQVGREVPDFSVPALDDSTVRYSRTSMTGRLYLIDFWATWCGPCVGEMPNLHDVYNRFRPRGFEILSLSFDRAPSAIAPFRASKWAMPWLHTFVVGGFESDLARTFEVMGIPKPILVDDRGRIVATEESLRGAELAKTLARLYGETP